MFAEAGGGHRVMAGSALELASALEPVAPPLEALLAASTVEAVGSAVVIEPLTAVTLKDGSTTSAARLVGVATPTTAIERGDEPPRAGVRRAARRSTSTPTRRGRGARSAATRSPAADLARPAGGR